MQLAQIQCDVLVTWDVRHEAAVQQRYGLFAAVGVSTVKDSPTGRTLSCNSPVSTLSRPVYDEWRCLFGRDGALYVVDAPRTKSCWTQGGRKWCLRQAFKNNFGLRDVEIVDLWPFASGLLYLTNNVETSYFTQLKMCCLMTTFRCPSDILITSWLFTAWWSTWPGNHLVRCVAELVRSCIPIHARRCLPDPKCLF